MMTAPLTIILLLWCPHLIFSDERSAVSRAEFAHAMSAIKPGATRDHVHYLQYTFSLRGRAVRDVLTFTFRGVGR